MADRLAADVSQAPTGTVAERGASNNPLRQWAILSRRNLEILVRNRANLIPLFVTPLLITVLLVLLYHAGEFSLTNSNPATPAQILFFLAFSGLFFGMSYGLQQICTEFPIFFREHRVNVAIVPYLLSKVLCSYRS